MNNQNRTLKTRATSFPIITVVGDAINEHDAVITVRVPTEHSNAFFNAIDKINQAVEDLEQDYENGKYDPCEGCGADDCDTCFVMDDQDYEENEMYDREDEF